MEGKTFMRLSKVRLRFAISIALAILVFMPVAAQIDKNDIEGDLSSSGGGPSVSLAGLLDKNGYIDLPEDFSGSIDATGFHVAAKRGEAPRFVRSNRSANDRWSEDEFGIPGCNGAVNALVAIGGDLFLGGSFTACGSVAVSYIARLDPASNEFTPLGDGVNQSVRALAAIGNDLYVGGTFNEAGGSPAGSVAKFDTTMTDNSGWSTLGNGVDGSVWALTTLGDDLFVGGSFSTAGTAPANNVARFSSATGGDGGWSAMGDGVDSTVFSLTVVEQDLYVGGFLRQAGAIPANLIATFDTAKNDNTGWSALGGGITVGGGVFALTSIGDRLYVGGNFSEADNTPTNNIAEFDTDKGDWLVMGDGVDDTVRAFSVVGSNLYVGGDFDLAGGASANRIAKFDSTQNGNSAWSSLGDGLNEDAWALTANATGDLYVGGLFESAGGSNASYIAFYDSSEVGNLAWSALSAGINGSVNALAAIGTHLYVGGTFTQVGNIDAQHIARFDTTRSGDSAWSSLGSGVNGPVSALVAIGDELYVGGSFSQAGSVTAGNIARFRTTEVDDAGWSTLGDGVNNEVWALATLGDDLYVGGRFTEAGAIAAAGRRGVAKFDTTEESNAGWSDLDGGLLSGTVRALAVVGTDLYVGGFFSRVGVGSAVIATNIARFNTDETATNRWSPLGSGVDGSVRSMIAKGTDLYVAGLFNEAGLTVARRVAVFDTTLAGDSGWSNFGNGLSVSATSALAIASVVTDIFVGGQFTESNGSPGSFISRLDTTESGDAAWSSLGDGTNNIVSAITSIGTDLYVGGQFSLAGGKANGGLARYNPPNYPPSAQNDFFTTFDTQAIIGNVFLDNGSGIDSDPDGDPLQVQNTGTYEMDGIGGSLVINVDGSFSYTPPQNESGVATFQYVVADSSGDTDTATLTVNVTADRIFQDRFAR